MIMKIFFNIFVLGLLLLFNNDVSYAKAGYSADINEIDNPDILISRRVWREINLKENANKPYFFQDKEITKIIVEGVLGGQLQPYNNDSLEKQLSIDEFKNNLLLPVTNDYKAAEDEDEGWGNKTEQSQANANNASAVQNYFLPNEISILEIMEDKTFNKRSSSWGIDIKTVKLIIPAEKFLTGLRREVATFSYDDLEKYFDSMPKYALWRNPKNEAGNVKLSDSFRNRLFHSTIVKLYNPENANLEDVYTKTPKERFEAAERLEQELIELEYHVWET